MSAGLRVPLPLRIRASTGTPLVARGGISGRVKQHFRGAAGGEGTQWWISHSSLRGMKLFSPSAR